MSLKRMILSLMGLCKLKRGRGSLHFLSKYASFATWSHKECRWREREKRAAGTMNVSWGPYLSYQVRVTILLCRQGISLGMKEEDAGVACQKAIHQCPWGRGPGPDVRVRSSSLAPASCGACQGTSLRPPSWPHFARL